MSEPTKTPAAGDSAAIRADLDVLREADESFGPVADLLLELAADASVSPVVYDRVAAAVFTVLEAWANANMAASNVLRLCDALYAQPGPPAEVQRLIREAGAAPDWATR